MKAIKYLLKEKFLFFSVIVAFFAGLALLHSGLPPTHDGEYHVIRFYEFYKVISSGVIYPRWAPDLNFGYGVPLFNYVYPLPNYVASIFHLFGVSFIDSFKLEMLLSTLIGGVFFYLWAKEFWGDHGGFISSAFYSFSPYHFVDMYVRGSVGEVWALGLFPLWLWSYTKFVRTKNIYYFLFSTLSICLIIFSHNILALMFFIFIPFYMGILIFNSKQKLRLTILSFLTIILSLGISSIFWFPALFETKFVEGLQIYNIQKNFPDLFQLFFPSWGTGFFDNDLNNQMSVQIGVANIVALFFSIITFAKLKNQKEIKIILSFFIISFFIIFFLITPFSYAIWKYAPLIHYFQFPWRLLSLLILMCSFLAGSFFYKKRKIVWVFIFLGILFITTYDYAHPAFYHLRNDSYYTRRSNFIDGTNSPGNLFRTTWTPVFSRKSNFKVLITKGKGSIISIIDKPEEKKYLANFNTPSTILFSTGYFPGWEVKSDKGNFLTKNVEGLIEVSMPRGKYNFEFVYIGTILEKFSVFSSLFFILLLISFFVIINVRKKYEI